MGICLTAFGLFQDWWPEWDFPGRLAYILMGIGSTRIPCFGFILCSKTKKEKRTTTRNTFSVVTPDHRELHLLGTTIDQVITYIKSIISAKSPYFNKDNEIVYYAEYSQTKFYDQQKNLIRIYGIVFAGLKYDLEFTEDGTMLRKRNEQEIPELFSLSIFPIGVGKGAKVAS